MVVMTNYICVYYKANMNHMSIHFWNSACASKVLKLQRTQSKLLRQIVCARWYIRNDNNNSDFNMPAIQDEIKKFAIKYVGKLTIHPNALVRDMLQFDGLQSLKRNDTLSLV